MTQATLEHVNFTVSDPAKTAAMLVDLFGWKIRWKGKVKDSGWTCHVGSDTSYVAIYTKGGSAKASDSYTHVGGLNHIGIVVDDLEAAELKVLKAGYVPHSHADYEPGRRFYFHDGDGIEYEIVSYD